MYIIISSIASPIFVTIISHIIVPVFECLLASKYLSSFS